MKEITSIHHIGIRVAQLGASRDFYEKLGFTFIAGPVGPEPVAIMSHPSGITINLILNATPDKIENILMDTPQKPAGYTHMALEVTDLEVIRSQLDELDIAITGGPIVLSDGASFIFVRDPDRNVIEFHKPGRDNKP